LGCELAYYQKLVMMQVETGDAHLPHTMWGNDRHDAGCEVDIVPKFERSSGDWGRRRVYLGTVGGAVLW
jgi:hypothetical protein